MPWESPRALRVLIVDSTNTVGSPLAERLLRRHLALRGLGEGTVEVSSAGFDAVDGEPMTPDAAALLARYGADAGGFVSRALTSAMLAATDFAIVGSHADREALLARHRHAAPKVFRMTEVAELYDLIVAIAPLSEHAAMLHSAREAGSLPEHYDLRQPAQSAEALLAFADDADKGAAWLAGVWASMAPAAPGNHAAIPADGQVTDIALDAFGVPVVVRCTGPSRDELAREVARIWSRCLRTDGRAPDVEIEACVQPDAEELAQARLRRAVAAPQLHQVLHALSGAVTVRAIDARQGELVMLHAAGIAMDDGRVVAFVAPSGTGKTTIARMLGRHYSYVTDETLAVTLDGTVLPYPKPLSLVTDHGLGIKDQWGPDSLGLRKPPQDTRLARIVVLERDSHGSAEPECSQMEFLEGLAALAAQVSYLGSLPRKLHTLADLVDGAGGVCKLRYSEAISLVSAMDDLLEGAS